MKVYVLTKEYWQEGGAIIGVYSTHDLALADARADSDVELSFSNTFELPDGDRYTKLSQYKDGSSIEYQIMPYRIDEKPGED